MPGTERKDIRFKSSNGRSAVAGVFWQNPDVAPWCVLQISHGMCEYMGRYADFAAFLAQSGVAVCGNDHIGHGDTAADADDLGYLDPKVGRRYAVRDLKTMNDRAHEAFPGLPVVLLGHSMGSFFARQYAVQYPQSISGLIISGTGGPNPLAGVGILLTRLISVFKGAHHRSKLVHNMAFGSYLRRIPAPRTPADWLSRDEAVVDQYCADPYCTYRFTVAGFGQLFAALRDVSGPKWAARMPRGIPLFMLSGDEDPVGAYGKGAAKVHAWLQKTGAANLRLTLYPGGRHEMLNETGRERVYQDVLDFLKEINHKENPRL